MGDNCSIQVVCRAKHVKVFERLGYVLQAKENGMARMIDNCRNSGHEEMLHRLSLIAENDGMWFWGVHDGACVPGLRFASAGRGLFSVPTIDGMPFSTISVCGVPDKHMVSAYRLYLLELRDAKRLLARQGESKKRKVSRGRK